MAFDQDPTDTPSPSPFDAILANAGQVAKTLKKRPRIVPSEAWSKGFGGPLSKRSEETYAVITGNQQRRLKAQEARAAGHPATDGAEPTEGTS